MWLWRKVFQSINDSLDPNFFAFYNTCFVWNDKIILLFIDNFRKLFKNPIDTKKLIVLKFFLTLFFVHFVFNTGLLSIDLHIFCGKCYRKPWIIDPMCQLFFPYFWTAPATYAQLPDWCHWIFERQGLAELCQAQKALWSIKG